MSEPETSQSAVQDSSVFDDALFDIRTLDQLKQKVDFGHPYFI
jgi:hypothetical protein